MKFSRVLLLGLAGAAVVVVAKRIINMRKQFSAADDDLLFDTDFIPGSKKLNLDIPEHINPSWFRTPKFHADDSGEPMFI